MPYAIRRVAAAPMTAAKMASTTRIPLTRMSLSSGPNSRMAKFFSHGGVKSICSSPTATTGDPLAPVSPATNCPTPSAVPAASSPAMAPSPARLRPSDSFSCPLFGAATARVWPARQQPGNIPNPAGSCYEYQS